MNVGPYSLRPHQVSAVEQTRSAMAECIAERKKPRVVMQGVCGFGKTIVSSYLMQQSIAKDRKPAFMVSGRQLVFQKSDKLCDASIEHTVVMADVNGQLRPAASRFTGEQPECAVISKDTYESLLKNHGVSPFDVGLWIIDEAHTAKSDGWWKIIAESSAPVVGMTATPCWSNGLGMGDRYSKLVVSATHDQLIREGFIVPCRMLAPWSVDTRDVDVNGDNGEYVSDQIESRCMPLVGGFCESWHKHAKGLKTVFYASSVAHSIAQAQQNSEGDGTLFAPRRQWEHIDAETPQKDRKRMYQALERGEIDGLCNYGVLRVGVDFPFVECLQLGVAMHSIVSYLQTCGRGGRPAPGKSEFLILDHGSHVARGLGWPQEDREWRLDDRKPMWERESESGRPPEKHCPKCGAVYRPSLRACPYCGEERVKTSQTVHTVEGELIEITPPPPKVKLKDRLSDEQNRFNRYYFPSSKSKSLQPANFNQLRARFMNDNPHLKIVYDGNQTVVVNLHNKTRHRLGYVPPPHSHLWDLPVRSVNREDLQRPWFA